MKSILPRSKADMEYDNKFMSNNRLPDVQILKIYLGNATRKKMKFSKQS